jgi:serine/threonine-protein kinase
MLSKTVPAGAKVEDPEELGAEDERATASIGPAILKPLRAVPNLGVVVAGKYRLERHVGRGGMGVVMEATHLALRETVALKFVVCSSAEATGRLLREARLMAAVKNDHVTRVLDVGTEDGVPYVVMDRLQGESLAELLAHRGPLPFTEAVTYARQACQGLGAAHAKGVIHRDFKPSNAFVARQPVGPPLVKLLDFGIAKELIADPDDDSSLTASTTVLGSPFYMAPEQVRSAKSVDQRADVWSLGVTLYELLAGVPPFRADTTPGVLAAVVADPPPSLQKARPEIPEELEGVILKCLAKNPADRYADMASLAAALAPFVGDEVAAGAGKRDGDPNPSRARRRIDLVAPLGLIAILGLGSVAWGAVRSPSRETLTHPDRVDSRESSHGAAALALPLVPPPAVEPTASALVVASAAPPPSPSVNPPPPTRRRTAARPAPIASPASITPPTPSPPNVASATADRH